MKIYFINKFVIALFLVLIFQSIQASDSIRVEKIIHSDWAAVVYYPSSQKQLPAIIGLGGSEGGLSFSHDAAKLMVQEGFVVMRFGYFKFSDVTKKQTLREIRIETVIEAIDWLKENPSIDSTKIALLGISKGAELALLVASKTKSVKAVAAHVPSHVVWYGLGKRKDMKKSSWKWQEKSLPPDLSA